MEHKRPKIRASEYEIMERLAAHLHEGRDGGQCATPLSSQQLERLLDGELDEREAYQARTHLSQCLFCLNAYSELAAASEALASIESPRTVAAASAQVEMPDVPRTQHAFVETLRAQILDFSTELQRAVKSRRHRAAQRQYSDPALVLEHLSSAHGVLPRAEISPKMVRQSHDAMFAKVSALERLLDERLQELQLLKNLIDRDAELMARIFEVDASIQRDLLSILASASNLLFQWIEQAAEGLASASRSR